MSEVMARDQITLLIWTLLFVPRCLRFHCTHPHPVKTSIWPPLTTHVSTREDVTMECVEQLIRKNNMMCPITGKKLKETDIITIMRVSEHEKLTKNNVRWNSFRGVEFHCIQRCLHFQGLE